MSIGTKYPNGENIFNPDGSFNSPSDDVSKILKQQKERFDWGELTQAVYLLLPNEVPVVTEYVKRFVASRPKEKT